MVVRKYPQTIKSDLSGQTAISTRCDGESKPTSYFIHEILKRMPRVLKGFCNTFSSVATKKVRWYVSKEGAKLSGGGATV